MKIKNITQNDLFYYNKTSIIKVDGFMDNEIYDEHGHKINIDNIDPIPLTIEILEKNDFKHLAAYDTDITKCYQFPEELINPKSGYVLEFTNNVFKITDHDLISINYVHEFQHTLRDCWFDDFANNFKV